MRVTADEARDISLNNLTDPVQSEVTMLCDQILETAKTGEFVLELPHFFQAATVEKLKSMGYKVNDTAQINGKLTISW